MRISLCIGLTLALIACGTGEKPEQQTDLANLRGQWVVINYWAQWCKPCIEEIPELNTLNHQFDEATVLGVNYDGASGEDLAQQEQKLGVEFASLAADPSAQLGIPRPVVLPTTLIVDPAGKVVATLIGPQTLDSLAAFIRPAGDTTSDHKQ
jgi:thiol-disulfide isomerase/thioredoxin